MKLRKKLIEVALPLEAINLASAREKSMRHGHPSTLHLWWARRPLAAARAVIFSQMVDDPSEYIDELLAVSDNRQRAEEELQRRRAEWFKVKALHEEAIRDGKISGTTLGPEATLQSCASDLERERLFAIIKQLVLWENTTNETIVDAARQEIWKSWRRTCADHKDDARVTELFNSEKLPAFHDPFAGGGALPLEAQRLGLEAYASDLNPVAVLINKATIEIPTKFAGRPPANPESNKQRTMAHKRWQGAEGLAEDVAFYGRWMREEAEKRIGHLYPAVEITSEMARVRPDLKALIGRKLTVIAWLWARTVKSPNPAFLHVDVPLASSFVLSTKAGKEAYVEPVVEGSEYRFFVKVGKPKDGSSKDGTKIARGANFRCLMSGTPISGDYIKAEGRSDRMGARLMAVIAEGDKGRVYLSPTPEVEDVANSAKPSWIPDTPLPDDPRNFWTVSYGLDCIGDLFTARQLVALTTFSDLAKEAAEYIAKDAVRAGWPDDDVALAEGGTGARAYAEGTAVYLSFLVSQVANHSSTVCGWNSANSQMRSVFARQSIPMVWDYAESNPFSDSSGSFNSLFERQVKGFVALGHGSKGFAAQCDVNDQHITTDKVVSTDPPYYDNISYADLSDFFYVWLRRSLKDIFPDLFATMSVPKAQELVVSPYRHNGNKSAEEFFMDGMTRALHLLSVKSHPAFPVTVYYAFKQSEDDDQEGVASTGWAIFLDAAIRAGFSLTGTWPIRTEKEGRVIGIGTNALASSIVLVCRPRVDNAGIATRREFLGALKAELPSALAHLQRGNIAPVDLAQAAIGPGMAVYTRYVKVLDAEGKPLSVRDALALINEALDEVLAEQEGDFDADTRWALSWFDQTGFEAGDYGLAETLSKAKNTSVQGMKDAGILDKKSPGGKVRLLRPSELPADWDPVRDSRVTVWEVVHHLVRRLESGGEAAAAELVSVLGGVAEVARELAYRLYTICERKKRAQEALSYNALVQSWPEISRLAREQRIPQSEQTQMFQQR
jgi:putative DNA methylase